jgi:cysteinyl-tRNA synthetase
MPIYIYNTLTRKKEEFVPIKKGRVGMYVCGPTVYDEPHIGHGRSAYTFDVIRRYLKYRGFKVKFARNVTDVDDKIIEKARAAVSRQLSAISLKDLAKEVSERYLKAYHEDMQALGILPPDEEPKATEYIPKMISFIGGLIKAQAAYESQGDVYFDIKKAKGYGKLSHQSLDKMEIGSRIAPGENKKDPLDFALWKKAKEGEPSWESPWGMGRPGWHIECSVMSSDILGDEFDIHAGGIDLIFPHHENEIAQSEGLRKKFARYWIHNGLLTINNEKMAKSLGNFITIKDFIAKYGNPDFLKIFFLSAHYSSPIDYTDEKIKEAAESLDRIARFLEKTEKVKKSKRTKEIEGLKDKFREAMDDDFNTPRAMACIFDLVNTANKNITDKDFVHSASEAVKELLEVFGILIQIGSIKDKDIEKLILERDKARRDKDYALSDKLRKDLQEKGIILEDTKEGTIWRRKV